MAVPNTLLLEKWAVADWDEWNSLPESIQNSAVLFHTRNLYRTRKNKTFQKTVFFHLASNHSNYLNQTYFHIFYISASLAGH